MAIPIQIILLIDDGVAHRMHSLQSSPFPQKELFSASTNLGGTVEGVPDGGPRCCHQKSGTHCSFNTCFRDRKLSTSSTGNMKSKWVNAFKNIKGKQEAG